MAEVQTDRQIDGRTDRQTDGQMDGWTNIQTNEQMDICNFRVAFVTEKYFKPHLEISICLVVFIFEVYP